MAKGISLHIGLNRVDPDAYDGWDGALSGCVNDANSMKGIADACGYASSVLLNDAATSDAVVTAIGQAARSLESGDYFLLTYSGHGGQVDDANGDENDGKDETWVLYDRMLVDDELYSLWAQFAAGVRIFMLSDSCHSGTVARALYVQVHDMMKKSFRSLPASPRFKAIPADKARFVEDRDRGLYRTLHWIAGNSRDMPIAASVILISGCQDNQLSQDGDTNGLFTQTLLEVWHDGSYEGDYPGFHSAISAKMPATQSPNYFKVGSQDEAFETHTPFFILGGMSMQPTDGETPQAAAPVTTSGPGIPSVTGPDSATRTEAPSFEVDLAGNPYFIFEMAVDKGVFDNPPDPNNPQYYGSWNDPDGPARCTGTHFQPSPDAWNLVKDADTLYYRVSTTSSETGWDDYQVSESKTMSVTDARSKDGSPAARAVRFHAQGRR